MEKRKLVIVEDEKAIAHAQKLILEDQFDIGLAHDGEEGIRLIEDMKPEVIILDLMLPKVDGFEVCKHVKNHPELKDIKVVMVTAKDSELDEIKGMGIGADDYIMKPFECDELIHVVNQVLNREEKQKDNSSEE